MTKCSVARDVILAQSPIQSLGPTTRLSFALRYGTGITLQVSSGVSESDGVITVGSCCPFTPFWCICILHHPHHTSTCGYQVSLLVSSDYTIDTRRGCTSSRLRWIFGAHDRVVHTQI
ncbi:uncharacterized protein CTRU02_207406 [Colletotrichum truncatum]|uniref:Uncharacterized protein n=1 Tax=Colletotrichum truncatum TaxID=5467 RepID=A0ACC3Z0Q3_COLTU|nr:uncharacterized protein CTRU02_00962 [Colletotrichum truncatum]KAF6800557.1 hypothetical protein CTRU02_00962 [Colletotrichum truncatum]